MKLPIYYVNIAPKNRGGGFVLYLYTAERREKSGSGKSESRYAARVRARAGSIKRTVFSFCSGMGTDCWTCCGVVGGKNLATLGVAKSLVVMGGVAAFLVTGYVAYNASMAIRDALTKPRNTDEHEGRSGSPIGVDGQGNHVNKLAEGHGLGSGPAL